MLDNTIRITTDYILKNYNDFIGRSLWNCDYWNRLPLSIQKTLYLEKKEIESQFNENYVPKKKERAVDVQNLSTILHPNDTEYEFFLKVELLLEDRLKTRIKQISFATEIKNTPLGQRCPAILKLLNDEELISTKKLRLGGRLSFKLNDCTFSFHQFIPYELQLILFSLARQGVEILFRPDPLNVTNNGNFNTPLRKAYQFGKYYKIDSFTNRTREASSKILYERFENPDPPILEANVYRFEIQRTERDRIFHLVECLPYPPNQVKEKFVNTYILHSESDFEHSNFIHIDASLLEYTKQSYERRCVNHIDKIDKAEKHYKMFRINNQLPIERWGDILVGLFPGNELVLEYLMGARYKSNELEKISDASR